MRLKDIEEMPLEDALSLERTIYYGRAWGGTLGHWWISHRETLCGQALAAHRHFHYQGARKHCARCAALRMALRYRREESERAGEDDHSQS